MTHGVWLSMRAVPLGLPQLLQGHARLPGVLGARNVGGSLIGQRAGIDSMSEVVFAIGWLTFGGFGSMGVLASEHVWSVEHAWWEITV